MKKRILIAGLVSLSAIISAQTTWVGSNTTGDATRTGNVTIGSNSAPTEKLQVDGNIKLQNNLVFNSLHGGAYWGSGGTGDFYFRRIPSQGVLSNWVEMMVVKANGNVGIGTVNPIDKLQVDGGVRVHKDGSETIGVQLYLGNAVNNRAFNFQLNAAGDGLALWGYDPSNGWNRGFTFKNNGTLGIGITTPQAYLHIKTPNSSGNGLMIDHSYTSAFSFAHLINVNHDQTKALVVQKMTGGNGTAVFQVWGNGTVNMKNVYAEAITVTPTAMTSWPDYVFKKEYKLMPLEELETYINKNNHLPNIPSAEEVSKKGVNVYDMNKALLEKVEEMSLYIIELKKELDEVKLKVK